MHVAKPTIFERSYYYTYNDGWALWGQILRHGVYSDVTIIPVGFTLVVRSSQYNPCTHSRHRDLDAWAVRPDPDIAPVIPDSTSVIPDIAPVRAWAVLPTPNKYMCNRVLYIIICSSFL